MTFSHALNSNNYGPAKFIVDASAANGTHTTIASALTSASSGDTIFIRPGTYTENLTLKAGINLTAYGCDAFNNVVISGNCTFTGVGTVNISGIRLQTNSAALLTISGSSASIVNLTNCYLNCTNNTGITFSSSSASANLNVYGCAGNLGTTGIALFAHSSAGTIQWVNCFFLNTGGSSTASTQSAGVMGATYTIFMNPITTSSTGNFTANYADIDTSAQNVTSLTFGGTANNVNYCEFASGTASAVSIGSTLGMRLCHVNSANTNAVTGAGSVGIQGILFSGSSSKINTSTQTGGTFEVGGISFDGGTNTLSNYATGTFTPTMVGTAVAGTTTYTNQTGYYTRIGQNVFIEGIAAGSAATGTGSVLLGGFPFTIKNQSSGNPIGTLLENNSITWVFPTGTTSLALLGLLNTTTANVWVSGSANSGAFQAMANAAFSMQYSLTYQI